MPDKGSHTIPPDKFCLAWEKAKSLEEVAQVLGMKVASAKQRAISYRKKGIRLKEFPKPMFKGKQPLPVEFLNKLIEQARKDDGQSPDIEGTRLK